MSVRWRHGAFSPASDLPPIRRGLWAAVAAAAAVAIWGWLRVGPVLLSDPLDDGGAWSLVYVIVVVAVPLALAVMLVYGVWRFQLERLAHRPGPVLVVPFTDPSGTTADRALRERPGAVLAAELTAMFQQYLVRCRIYGSTAIPASGRSADFLSVIERVGDSAGVWGVVGRLPRLLFPVSAYQVECTVLPAAESAPHGGEVSVLVELTRFPRSLVAPVVFRDETWERAIERAAHWVAGTIVPRTRQCHSPPWTTWRGLRLPDDLFDHYQRYQHHLRHQELDAAMGALRAARLLDPGNLALRLELGKLQEQLGMQLDALATYEELIGRASRGDRGLALLWNLAPSQWGAAEPDKGDDPAWSDSRRVVELPARHPVVYVARYRHMLLLGLGGRLAEQWWVNPLDQPASEGRAGEASAEARICERRDHWPAHERRSEYSRRILARRLGVRYPWVVEELTARKLLTRSADVFLREVGDLLPVCAPEEGPPEEGPPEEGPPEEGPPEEGPPEEGPPEEGPPEEGPPKEERPPKEELEEGEDDRQPDAQARATDLSIFLTTTSVCELELLLLERGTDLTTRPSVREVVSLRTLALVLPWGVMRAGRAIQYARVRTRRPEYAPQLAGRSIVRRRTRPDILGDRGAGLLDNGWPPDLDVLKAYVGYALRSRVRTLFSWHEHYNAACAFALALLPPRDDAGRSESARAAAEAAVSQLYKAVACGDSGFLASQRDWLLTQDPDLDVLRGTEAFFELEAATYGSVRATGRRGPDMVLWQIRTYTAAILADLARRMEQEWDARPSASDAGKEELRRWLILEQAAWEIVEGLARDHRDSAVRQAAVEEIRARCRPYGSRPSQVYPRFSERVLEHQCASMGVAPTHPVTHLRDRIAEQVRGVLAAADTRFAVTAEALRREPAVAVCCVREWDLVSTVEVADLLPLVDWPVSLGAGSRARFVIWAQRSRERWGAMSVLYDDENRHETSMDGRQRQLRNVIGPV